MAAITLEYLGDLRVQATHEPSGTTVMTDLPEGSGGQGSSFEPSDLLGAAVGSCMLSILGVISRNKGIDISGTTVRVSKEMVLDGPRRVTRLATTITVPHKLSDADCTRLERGARSCPVHRSLHPDIDAPITFVFDAGGGE